MACLKFRTDLRVYIVIQTGAIALKKYYYLFSLNLIGITIQMGIVLYFDSLMYINYLI